MTNNPTLGCRTILTEGQGRRMRYLIATGQVHQGTSTPVMVDPVISSTTTWTTSNTPNNGDFLVEGNLTIQGGATLTVESGVTVRFDEDSKVKVEQDAKLELFGTLTSSTCSSTWLGVEVDGGGQGQIPTITTTYPPTIPNIFSMSFPDQGAFIGRSGGLIENAYNAVNLSGSSGAGGIILCEGTNFINSVDAIVFRAYENIWSHGIFDRRLPYIGFIGNCYFEVNDYFPHSDPFNSFINMTAVNGPWISSCTFSNNMTYELPNGENIWEYGYGIQSYGAGFICDNGSEFNLLGYGINVWALGEEFPFKVEDCTFDQCIVGIYDNDVSGPTILNNFFYMGELPFNYLSDDQYGIYLKSRIVGFIIQENEFINESESDDDIIGIRCDETGNFNKGIRRNTFEGLKVGNYVKNNNGEGLFSGLLFLCNTNENVHQNGADFLIEGSIRRAQGLPVNIGEHDAAGNTFSYTGTDFNYNGLNPSTSQLYYFYQPNDVGHNPMTTVGNILKLPADDNLCNPEFFTSPPLDTQIIENLREDYYELKKEYLRLASIYDSSPLQAIIDSISYYRFKMDEAAYAIVTHNLNDTISYIPDSIYTWIGNLDRFEGDLWLAREQLADADHLTAVQTLNNIPSRFSLSAEQLNDLNNYTAISNHIGVQSVYELDSATLSFIQYYENIGGYAEAWARGILSWYGANYSLDEFNMPIMSPIEETKTLSLNLFDRKLIVYPNPARDKVNFFFKGEIPKEGGILVIKNIHGKVCTRFDPITKNLQWDSSGFSSGVYFFQLYSNGEAIEIGKLILEK